MGEKPKLVGLRWQSCGYQQNRHEKDPRSCHSSYRLFWKPYGYHHNQYENQPGTYTVLMDYFGNLQVTSSGHQQNWYKKTPGAAKNRISYFGNLMVTITTDAKISLEHSKFLWITLAILRSPAKLVREKLLAQPQFL